VKRGIMRLKKFLDRNFKTLGIIGLISSWLTIILIWGGFVTLPFISFVITGGFFGLAFMRTPS
jgi:hypothetical protein